MKELVAVKQYKKLGKTVSGKLGPSVPLSLTGSRHVSPSLRCVPHLWGSTFCGLSWHFAVISATLEIATFG